MEDNIFLEDLAAGDLVAAPLEREDSSPYNDAAFFLFILSNSSKHNISEVFSIAPGARSFFDPATCTRD